MAFISTPGQYMNGVMGTLPYEYLDKTLASMQDSYDKTIEASDKLKGITIPHANTPEAINQAKMISDDIASKVDKLHSNFEKRGDIKSYYDFQRGVKALSNEIARDSREGKIYNLIQHKAKYESMFKNASDLNKDNEYYVKDDDSFNAYHRNLVQQLDSVLKEGSSNFSGVTGYSGVRRLRDSTIKNVRDAIKSKERTYNADADGTPNPYGVTTITRKEGDPYSIYSTVLNQMKANSLIKDSGELGYAIYKDDINSDGSFKRGKGYISLEDAFNDIKNSGFFKRDGKGNYVLDKDGNKQYKYQFLLKPGHAKKYYDVLVDAAMGALPDTLSTHLSSTGQKLYDMEQEVKYQLDNISRLNLIKASSAKIQALANIAQEAAKKGDINNFLHYSGLLETYIKANTVQPMTVQSTSQLASTTEEEQSILNEYNKYMLTGKVDGEGNERAVKAAIFNGWNSKLRNSDDYNKIIKTAFDEIFGSLNYKDKNNDNVYIFSGKQNSQFVPDVFNALSDYFHATNNPTIEGVKSNIINSVPPSIRSVKEFKEALDNLKFSSNDFKEQVAKLGSEAFKDRDKGMHITEHTGIMNIDADHSTDISDIVSQHSKGYYYISDAAGKGASKVLLPEGASITVKGFTNPLHDGSPALRASVKYVDAENKEVTLNDVMLHPNNRNVAADTEGYINSALGNIARQNMDTAYGKGNAHLDFVKNAIKIDNNLPDNHSVDLTYGDKNIHIEKEGEHKLKLTFTDKEGKEHIVNINTGMMNSFNRQIASIFNLIGIDGDGYKVQHIDGDSGKVQK